MFFGDLWILGAKLSQETSFPCAIESPCYNVLVTSSKRKKMKHLLHKTIEIKDIQHYEFDPDVGMRFVVKDVRVKLEGTEDEHFELVLDFSKFEKYNEQFMVRNYYDDNGQATLNWKESGMYPKFPVISIWLNADDEGEVFTVVGNNDLLDKLQSIVSGYKINQEDEEFLLSLLK